MPAPHLPATESLQDRSTGLPNRVWVLFFQFFSSLLKGEPAKCTVTWGMGSPENVVAAPVGSLFLRTNGGAGSTLYVKEANATAVGWVAK